MSVCLSAGKALTLSDGINKTDNIVRMEEEQSLASPDTHATCPNGTNWADPITTESVAERDRDKREETRKIKTDKR